MAIGACMIAESAVSLGTWAVHDIRLVAMVPAMASLLPQSNTQPQDATEAAARSLKLSAALDLKQCVHAGT